MKRVSLKHLTSKLLAGGLTAGIVLIWWPNHYPTDGLQWLVLRGIVATLGFELMLMAYAPIEDRIVSRLARRLRAGRLRERVSAVPAPARTGGSLLFAGGALALPVLLLASAAGPLPDRDEAQPVKVVREVVVKRQVVRDETVVPAAATDAPADEAPTSEPRSRATAASSSERVPDEPERARRGGRVERGATSGATADRDGTFTPERDAPASGPGDVPLEPDAEPPASAGASPAPPVDDDAATAAAETRPAG